MRGTNKFRNYKTGGFDSRLEQQRFLQLKEKEEAGEISDLRRQVRFELIPAQYINSKCVERKCEYIADFVYVENGIQVVEDVKGYKTDVYKIKKKMMLYLLGVRVEEWPKKLQKKKDK